MLQPDNTDKDIPVMESRLDTLRLIAMQNQLLLTIGSSLDAREQILTFMELLCGQLDLVSAHLYVHNKNSGDGKNVLRRYQSLPDADKSLDQENIIQKLSQALAGTSSPDYTTHHFDNNTYTAFAFGHLGIFILEENRNDLQDTVKDILVPVITRLADHYNTCIQQQRLDKEAKVNKAAQLTYKQQAKRDPLTNLPNRREFHYSLSREISNAQRYGHFGALMYIDLDNFKNVNDSLGHSIGDILLTLVAQRLTEQKRRGDIVFRIGGDEFVYILSNVGNNNGDAVHTSIAVADRIIEALAKPIDINEFSLHITPSIGIATFPDALDDGSDSENILRHADTAMYRAKKQGKNCYAFFDPEMHVEASKRLIIEDHLRKAITQNEFTMLYQPIIDTHENIIGAESLIRWNSPVLGVISPEEFINIAEESNLILQLSDWVTKHVCTYAGELYNKFGEDSTVSYISINISPRQFIQSDFVESITAIIDTCPVPNDFIKLEFTENVLLDNIDSTIEKMEKLQEKNIDFLLDDFGTGYSSLSYLHKLPIKLLKIDKSFVDDFYSEKDNSQAIVNAILVMAEQLGIKCIIEGVELEKHANYFKQKNVYGIQGYYYHKPVTGDELIRLLANDGYADNS